MDDKNTGKALKTVFVIGQLDASLAKSFLNTDSHDSALAARIRKHRPAKPNLILFQSVEKHRALMVDYCTCRLTKRSQK